MTVLREFPNVVNIIEKGVEDKVDGSKINRERGIK